VKNLPKGATVIDYAYQIHTDVGNKMVAAKVGMYKQPVSFHLFSRLQIFDKCEHSHGLLVFVVQELMQHYLGR
jgi:hypothetical protein